MDYVALAVGAILLATIWLEPLGGLSVAIGLVAAGAAFSLQEVVTSVVGWLLIISGQAFRIGDRIQVGDVKGDVIGYSLLRTTLLELDNWVQADQHTGRTVVLPNSVILNQSLYNHTRYFHFTWDEIRLLVAASSNWRRAEEICQGLIAQQSGSIVREARSELENMAQRFLIDRTEIRPAVYLSLNGNVVTVAMRYLAPARQRRRTRDALTRAILDALSEAGDVELVSQIVTVRGLIGSERSD